MYVGPTIYDHSSIFDMAKLMSVFLAVNLRHAATYWLHTRVQVPINCK